MKEKTILPKEIKSILPRKVLDEIENINISKVIEEVRFRCNKNISIDFGDEEKILKIIPTKEDINLTLNLATNYSFYSSENSIKDGYITTAGGHRIGFSGNVIIQNNEITSIKHINSLNIRIAREIIGSSSSVISYILEDNIPKNTLIISPPKVGKTTILRDLARVLSTPTPFFKGYKVCICDERNEISGSRYGIPQLNIGKKSDVLVGGDKPRGISHLIRSMSPEIIITDEIGKGEDFRAIENACLSGVKVICSTHGSSLEDILKNTNFSNSVKNKVFETYIVLSNKENIRYIQNIYDENLQEVFLTCTSK